MPDKKQEMDTRNNITMALGALGGGAAGYLGSKYLMDINDTPLNMLAAGGGAGLGLFGASYLTDQGKAERKAEAKAKDRIAELKDQHPESAIGYAEANPTETAASGVVGGAALGALALAKRAKYKTYANIYDAVKAGKDSESILKEHPISFEVAHWIRSARNAKNPVGRIAARTATHGGTALAVGTGLGLAADQYFGRGLTQNAIDQGEAAQARAKENPE